ncbi:hypothetical protein NEOLEDRAFT_363545 [Neolentinus lepideus HHB14362 ss-1]|uniref:Uncharacterized protein n=1 Tax=Neolentinus lepideus HHB14362 ss-1 TaxID=1314782 RepID=A0A165SP33_9AGAM|nr:hypothetical protein NEOLEDRAFT_363545 [Neolentinus lepideus HHB14362 ss-1]
MADTDYVPDRLLAYFADYRPCAYTDPDSPPSRPASALSGGSGSSFINYTDSEEETSSSSTPESYVHPRLVASAMLRDKKRCVLCGSKKDLTVVRVTGADDEKQRIAWLSCLGLIPEHFHRDHPSNLMTLCHRHAIAYRSHVWRFVPCKEDRRIMLAYEKQDRMARRQHQSRKSQLVRQVPKLSHRFDLAIFQVAQMPAYEFASGLPVSTSIDRGKRTYIQLPIEPFAAFSATLGVAGSCYWPPPDAFLEDIERDLRDLRDAYNDLV